METQKARARRERERFFEKYIHGKGIDIGCGSDPLTQDCMKWDLGEGDATFMKGVPTEAFDWVYSSHCLEDIANYKLGLINWWNLVKPGGYLILLLPHRDLFERRKTLPSAGNSWHKWFFLIDRNEDPVTVGVIPMINTLLQGYDIEYVKKCDDGYRCDFRYKPEFKDGYQVIANGEFSIEAVIRKVKDPVRYVEEFSGQTRDIINI